MAAIVRHATQGFAVMFEDSDDITDDGGVLTASVRLLPWSSFDTGLHEELSKGGVGVMESFAYLV